EFELETFSNGETILHAGDLHGDKFYIVRSGVVNVFEPKLNKQIATLNEGDWFGEMALLTDEPRTAHCKAGSRVECFVLQRHTFQTIKENSKVLIATSEMRRASNAKTKAMEFKQSIKSLKIKDFERLRILGKGTFGTVYLVKVKDKL